MKHRTAITAGLILAPIIITASIGGIWLLTDGPEQESSPIGGVEFAPNRTVPTTPPFHLEGEIHYQFAPSQVNDASFEDVMLCMYDSNEEVIASENLGTFDGSAEFKDISVTSDRVPNLILIHHPRFYSIDGFQTEVLIYDGASDRFRESHTNDVSFPYGQVERGTCVPSS